MMEKTKTIVLTLLVVVSLVQSFLLSYNMPNFEPIQKAESSYIQTDEIGTEEKIENLVFPEQIILHLGENKHTIFSPDYVFYNEIYKRLQGRKFDGIQKNPAPMFDLTEIRNEEQGIELLFGQGVPVNVLRKVMQIEETLEFDQEIINRILIFTSDDKDTVRALFFNTAGNSVYEATRADLTVQDVKQHVGFGQSWSSYRVLFNKFYIPEEKPGMVEVEIPYEQYTIDQMQRNLFVDPNAVRKIQEKDGSEIYTDVKRSIQYRPNHQWIAYSDPAASLNSTNDISENVFSAVQFVNQHGGWVGKHRLTINPNRSKSTEMVFQQYYGAFPIVSNEAFPFGRIQLKVEQGVVTSYERSLIHFKEQPTVKTMRYLEGGDELESLIRSYSNKNGDLEWVFLAYKPRLEEDVIRLIPTWAVRLKDGTLDYLK